MIFRTEMGLYYSYYKTVVHAPTMRDGVEQLLYNNHTEYPSTINTLKRFNLYPEVVIGLAYRIFNQSMTAVGVEALDCFTITRKDLPAIQSCTGLSDPTVFYVNSVYLWNGLTGMALVGLSALLSESVAGTIICMCCYFYNFNDATRIQWTPPLRESFAYPLLLVQMFATTRLLIRNQTLMNTKNDVLICIAYVVVTTSCLLSWQFSQFVLCTQVIAMFMAFSFHHTRAQQWHRTVQYISCMHLCSIFIAYLLLFMNDMLFTSFYTAAVMSSVVVSRTKALNTVKRSPMKMIVQMMSFVIIAISIKLFVAFVIKIQDDSHIWNILKSKISNYRDFHTMIYTCAPEFDFLKIDAYAISTASTLGLSLVLAIGITSWAVFKDNASLSLGVLYNIYQCMAFVVMALMFMRLKMFLTPHLCILSSLAFNPRFLKDRETRWTVAFALISLISASGVKTVLHQHSHQGEYSNPALEDLLTFINDYAEPTDSFAGPMPLMANILLSTGRPVVNHPHYENEALREKTKNIYTLLSRKPISEVHDHLRNVSARFVVIPKAWCHGQMKTGCALVDIWDELDPGNKHRPQVCERLDNDDNEGLFDTIYKNDEFTMLSIIRK